MAARRNAVCAGSLTVGGASNKWVSAIDVRRAKLLLPMPKPSTTELLRRVSEWRLLLLLATKWENWILDDELMWVMKEWILRTFCGYVLSEFSTDDAQ